MGYKIVHGSVAYLPRHIHLLLRDALKHSQLTTILVAYACSTYVLIMLDEITDEMRLKTFNKTLRHKIDLRRMTSVCSGDRELARSLVVSALREIADDIENGN